jgi:hypothetical protein
MLFDKKRKWKSIPIPFKIVGISIKISSSLTKMKGLFESFNMKEAKCISGFEPKGIFHDPYGINQLFINIQ